METLLRHALKISNIDSVIHVGGHIGQEVDIYKSLDFTRVIYFEPVASIDLTIAALTFKWELVMAAALSSNLFKEQCSNKLDNCSREANNFNPFEI